MHVETLGRSRYGINVDVRHVDRSLERLYNVNENILRCAIGEGDMEYLIESPYQELCVPLSELDYREFKSTAENSDYIDEREYEHE